jgi:hypothetical protein
VSSRKWDFRFSSTPSCGLSPGVARSSALNAGQLASPLLSPKVSVSGHVYDIATGRLTTTIDARYP